MAQAPEKITGMYVADSINAAYKLERALELFYSQFELDSEGKPGLFFGADYSKLSVLTDKFVEMYVLNVDPTFERTKIKGKSELGQLIGDITKGIKQVDDYCVDSIDNITKLENRRKQTLDTILDLKKRYGTLAKISFNDSDFESSSLIRKIEKTSKANNAVYSALGNLANDLGMELEYLNNHKVSPSNFKESISNGTAIDAEHELNLMKQVAYQNVLTTTELLVRYMFNSGCDSVIDLHKMYKVNNHNLTVAEKLKTELDFELKTSGERNKRSISEAKFHQLAGDLSSEIEGTVLYMQRLAEQSPKMQGFFYENTEARISLDYQIIAKAILSINDVPQISLETTLPEFPKDLRNLPNYKEHIKYLKSEIERKDLRTTEIELQKAELSAKLTRALETVNTLDISLRQRNTEIANLEENVYKTGKEKPTEKSNQEILDEIHSKSVPLVDRFPSMEQIVNGASKLFGRITGKQAETYSSIDPYATENARPTAQAPTPQINLNSMDTAQLYNHFRTQFDSNDDLQKIYNDANAKFGDRINDYNIVFAALGGFYAVNASDIHSSAASLLQEFGSQDIADLVKELKEVEKKHSKDELKPFVKQVSDNILRSVNV
ncbi:MAG: hypothetical protein Q8O89_03800 [Nanoarchaeota archaeon]|nr:hypothetical protein [Nanoarchaeota archaeon]